MPDRAGANTVACRWPGEGLWSGLGVGLRAGAISAASGSGPHRCAGVASAFLSTPIIGSGAVDDSAAPPVDEC